MVLKPYTIYRECEPPLLGHIPWLTRLPDHWQVVPSKRLFVPRKERAREDDIQLSATQAYGVIPQAEFERLVGRKVVRITHNLEKRAHVEPDDFVISMRSFQGGLERAWARGCIRSSYVVLEPTSDIHVGYFAHLFKCADYISALQATSNFIRDGQDLNFGNFSLVDLPLPPMQEQEKIARFLDWESSRLEKFIRNKRRLIELLKEQKQNIINQAVTRGLDPNVKLKPSGVEWIEHIPAHWEATKLKRVVRFNPSKSETGASQDDEGPVVFLPMERISVNGEVDCTERRPVSEVWDGFTYFRRGDVVLAKITPCFENGKGACLKTLKTEFGFGTTELIVLRPSKSIKGEFLRFLTSTKQFLQVGEQFMTGAAGQQRIPSDFVKEYPIGLPPVNEQQEILDHIRKKSGEIDQAITRAEPEIELIREYRTRLISDVVTGQVDVRGIEVPEVTEEELQALDNAPEAAEELVDDEAAAEVAQ